MNDAISDDLSIVRSAAAEVMQVDDLRPQTRDKDGREPLEPLSVLIERDGRAEGRIVRVRGELLVPAEEAYDRLVERLRPIGRTPLLRQAEEGKGVTLLVMPGLLRKSTQRVPVAALLFVLTALSVLYVGSLLSEEGTGRLLSGLPFAASLLGILTAHEAGHYVVARLLGVPASLPYFIPFPLPPLGTMGAVINMTAPPRNRRQLLAIAVAGPLAGLAVAIPVLWYGLSRSTVGPLPVDTAYTMEGNSLLYAGLKYLMFGRLLPSGGIDVSIHSIAFAGWAGLLVTSLNLIPAGQLDGGHIFYALFGKRVSRAMYWVILFSLAGLAFVWVGWLIWVALIFFFGRIQMAPLNDVTPLTGFQRAVAVLMLVVFVVVFIPAPLTVIQP